MFLSEGFTLCTSYEICSIGFEAVLNREEFSRTEIAFTYVRMCIRSKSILKAGKKTVVVCDSLIVLDHYCRSNSAFVTRTDETKISHQRLHPLLSYAPEK